MKKQKQVEIVELIRSNSDIVHFGSVDNKVDPSWIIKAEIKLNINFTNSYKWFLDNFYGGEIAGEEIYSIYGMEFDEINGGDIVYQNLISRKNKLSENNELIISETDLGEVFFFNYSYYKNRECPIYIRIPNGDTLYYAEDFYEFLYKRINEYIK